MRFEKLVELNGRGLGHPLAVFGGSYAGIMKLRGVDSLQANGKHSMAGFGCFDCRLELKPLLFILPPKARIKQNIAVAPRSRGAYELKRPRRIEFDLHRIRIRIATVARKDVLRPELSEINSAPASKC